MYGDNPRNSFLPVVFGSDIGAYSIARSFWEAYGVRTVVFGRFASSLCAHSKMVDYRVEPRVGDASVLVAKVWEVAAENPGRSLLLFGCNEAYVRIIASKRAYFPEEAADPYADAALIARLTNKRDFYALLDEIGLAHPKTVVYRSSDRRMPDLPFDFPVIVKPADSADYGAHPFPGQCKVWRVADGRELESVVARVYGAGYGNDLVVQELIPGDDACMRVVTCYARKGGDCQIWVGHVLLEEHAFTARGNHALIISENDSSLERVVSDLLAHVGYVGLANVDIKVDPRDGSYRFFDFNARQGRSNYYVTAAGTNLARIVAAGSFGGDVYEGDYAPGLVWSVVPRSVAQRAGALCGEAGTAAQRVRRWVNPLWTPDDLGPARLARLLKMHVRQTSSFRNNPDWLGVGGER